MCRPQLRPDRLQSSGASDALARVGLAARGVIYLLIAVLAASLAASPKGKHADQKGAVTTLAGQPFGRVLVVVLAVGLAAYALWMLSQVVTGVSGEEDTPAKRARAAVSGLAYIGLCVTCVSVLVGARKPQSKQQEALTARVMQHTGGRWLVGLVGVVIVVVGVVLIWQGVQASFMERMQAMPGNVESVVKRLGQVGSAGRGAVVAIAGFLVAEAAVSFDPDKARGLDGALKTLVHQPFGRVLVVVAALALAAFGVFGLCEAKYRKV